MAKLIAISLNPNIGMKAGLRAIPQLLSNNLERVREFERMFARIHGKNFEAASFYTGRTAWYALLKNMGISEGDEVLVPAFTQLSHFFKHLFAVSIIGGRNLIEQLVFYFLRFFFDGGLATHRYFDHTTL